MKCPACKKTMRATINHASHDDRVMITLWCVQQYKTDCTFTGSYMISVENISQWLMSDNNMRITSVEVTA